MFYGLLWCDRLCVGRKKENYWGEYQLGCWLVKVSLFCIVILFGANTYQVEW